MVELARRASVGEMLGLCRVWRKSPVRGRLYLKARVWWCFSAGRGFRNIGYLSHMGDSGSQDADVRGSRCACVNVNICSLQAKDKDRWVRLFSQFCNKTANEEEEIVHKLLGDKFKVGVLPWPLHPNSLG